MIPRRVQWLSAALAVFLVAARLSAQDSASPGPSPAPSATPTPAPAPAAAPPDQVLLIDSLGRVISVPTSSLPQGLLPPADVGLANQVPNNAARGGKLPAEVMQRLETTRPQAFTLFPSAQPSLMSYLAGQDELGNTLVRPGPLLDTFPLETQAQGAKYWASQRGLRYSLRQTLMYEGLDDPETGSAHLGFYTMDLETKWTVFHGPESAGWLSAQIEAQTGLNSAGGRQDAGQNIGSLTDPNGIWSSHEGFRVPELAWQQAWQRGKFVVLAGIINQGNYLDGNLYANTGRGQFLNSALINSMVVPLPSYNFGVNLQWQPSDEWYGMLGVTVGNAGAGQQPWTDFRWSDWSAVSELGFAPNDFLGLGPGIYRIQPFLARAGGPTQGGVAFNFQQQLGRDSPLGWFGRFGIGGSQVSAGASTQVATGLVLQAPLEQIGLASRLTNDVFGAGFVWSQPSATTQTVYHRNEYVFEAVYTLQFAPAVRIQPDFQLVWNPVFNPAAGPSAVFQLEWLLSW